MTNAAHGLALMMHSASRQLTRRFEDQTRDGSLTSAQWRLLVLLRRDGAIRQARLAEGLEIEPISVSRMVDRMEQSGWVERLPDPNDRRARLVRATPKARASLARFGDVAEGVYADALAGFSPAEVETLMNLVGRMVTNLSTARETSNDNDRGGEAKTLTRAGGVTA